MSDLERAISSELRAEMARQRISHKELAGMSGLSDFVVRSRLSGKTGMGVAEMLSICKALHVSAEAITAAAEASLERAA